LEQRRRIPTWSTHNIHISGQLKHVILFIDIKCFLKESIKISSQMDFYWAPIKKFFFILIFFIFYIHNGVISSIDNRLKRDSFFRFFYSFILTATRNLLKINSGRGKLFALLWEFLFSREGFFRSYQCTIFNMEFNKN